jgi:AcrR family transcriptional regulator
MVCTVVGMPHDPPEQPALTATQQRILDAAGKLFDTHGVRGVGVNTIIAESGVAKDTLYRHYPAKNELVVAVLRRRDAQWCGWLKDGVQRRATTPADQLLAVFDVLDGELRARNYRGSAFLAASTDYTDPEHPVRRACAEHKARVRAWLGDLARNAGADDPAELAYGLMLLIDGALCARTMQNDRQAGARARRTAQILLQEVSR